MTRELRRNASGPWNYNPSRAIRMARERHWRKNKYRIDGATWTMVEKLLGLGWSPEQISNRLELESGCIRKVSHETIYRHVYRDKQKGGDLHVHLRRRHTYRKRIHKYHVADRLNHRPRKVLDFRTPDGDFNDCFVALIT